MYASCRATLSDKILDEISLEGLEGVTLSTLWLHLGESLNLKDMPEKLKTEIWYFIQRNTSQLQFYELPTNRPTLPLYKRFEVLDPDYGVPVCKDESPQRRYKLVPIQDNGIVGSCECYKERTEISSDCIKEMSLDGINEKYGERFVIVASQELRYNALFPSSVLISTDIVAQLYCMLEIVGRSRYNGETTSGSSSLQDYCKDATFVFYVKHQLLKMGVVATQNYNELRKGRLMLTTLMRLPRFYTAYQSALDFVIETTFNALKASPTQSLPLIELRTVFPAEEKFTSLKKIVQTHQFRRLFNVNSVPYPGISKRPRSEESKGRIRVVVSLRDPSMSSEDLFKERENNDDSEQPAEVDNSSFNQLAYVDMLLKDQVYEAIFANGVRGLSQSEIGCYLGITNLAVRQILKNLGAKHLVSMYYKDAGRQRVKMYVAIEYAENISKYNESMQEIKKLKCDDEPTLPPPTHQKLLEVAEIHSTVQHYKYTVKGTRELSNRQISRTAIVIKALNEKCLIHVFEIMNLIATKEKELGFKDSACRRSIRRILNHLSENGTVNIYEVVLKLVNEKNIRIHRFLTHPKIHIDHEVIKKEILSLKTAFYLKIEEYRLQIESARRAAELKLEKKAKNKINKEAQKKKAEQKREVFQKIPKFLVSRFMHEFLYYIVVELSEYKLSEEITEEILQNWKQTEPALLTREYMELLKNDDADVKAYSSELTWRTFIPPLPKYSDKPAGWIYLIDAIERMPLSIFMKIFRLENNLHSSLEKYVSHPIRQHYLINQLPVELNSLINRIYMQKVFITVLKLLNNMGLVQVSDQTSKKDKLRMWVFFNRNAIIVDTTTSEASYSRINPDRKYESIRYVFNTFEDVYRYWMNLQRICIYTKLGFRKDTERHKQRIKELSFIEFVDFDEAMLKDNGYLPGDGLGAAGLSTELFAHVFRNWSWAITSSSKHMQRALSRNRRLAQMSAVTKKVVRIKKSATRKKQSIPVTLIKRIFPTQSSGGSKSSTTITGSSTNSIAKRSKSNFRDAIDREALKNMRTLRVTWSAEEDKLLKIARAVYVFLSPPVVSLPLVVVSKICRDIIRHTIGIRNKTIQACLRRYHFLIKNHRHLPETPLWVNMLQTNDQLTEKYTDDFIIQLKQIYPNRNEYCNALIIHFIEVMCYLFKQVHNIEESIGPKFCIPDSLIEFQHLYSIRMQGKDEAKLVLHENPKTDYDLKVSVVYGLLHCSMCCIRDKTLFTLQAFEIFKHFTEEVLKSAYTKARTDGLAVALKRRNMTAQSASNLTGPSYLLSSKYRLKLIFLKIPYQTYEAIYNAIQNIFEELYSSKYSAVLRHGYEMKSPHIGQLLCMSEGLAKNFWDISIQFPTSILTVDSEQPICSSDRILHHYHGILDNAPKIEYIKNFNSENAEKRQVRVKFHSANLSYKIYYAPYDLLSKLPTRYLHFFCALDHLQQNVDINFSKLHRREDDVVLECPFNCIMKNANYLDAIERIVHQKKNIINELQETPAQKLLNQVVTSGNTIKIQTSNLLSVVRMLEKAWRDKEEQYDRKDVGKKLMAITKDRKVIDWLKICQNILEFNTDDDDVDKSDEFEPLLTKDDRIRDAFVINLPTIKLEQSDILRADKKTQYNDWNVAQSLLPLEATRDEILEKVKRDSIWMYTEETLKTLIPNMEELKFSAMEQKHIEEIHDFIGTKNFGVSFKELMHEFPYRKFLNRALKFLMNNFLVKRVGVALHLYVHKAHLREWVVHTFHITRRDQENLKAQKRIHDEDGPSCSSKRLKRNEDQQGRPTEREEEQEMVLAASKDALELPKERDVIVLRPRPWIRLNGSLNRRIIDRWLGSILSECVARYGCFITELCEHFQNMYPADIHFLLEILCDIKCICLKEIHTEETDIFSDYKSLEEISVNEVIDPDCTYVMILPDALMRMTSFIGDKKYNAEFV